jgi:predicted RNA polymerase sigma factor
VAGAANFAGKGDGAAGQRQDMPEPFREAIMLREVNDLSYKEIAQVAGVQVGTVMSRLARARSMLRTAWNLQQNVAYDAAGAAVRLKAGVR